MSEHGFNPENNIAEILLADETEPDWLIKDMLLQGTLACFAGAPAAGKSYVSYTIALALASGCSAMNGIIPAGEPRRVLYFDNENSPGDRNAYLRRSFNGLAVSNGAEPDLSNLVDNFWPVHFQLGGDDWFERTADWIDFVKPHLMVFDTAVPCFAIEDENSNAEATKAINDLRRLMAMTDPVASAIVLKHAKFMSAMDKKQGAERSMRGAKAWQGSADQVWYQIKYRGRPRKHNLSLTRLEGDKSRAYGLTQTIYFTPSFTDDSKRALVLEASLTPTKDHKSAITRSGDDEEGDSQ